ncbi:hypothetical protein RFI_26589 [Reticulomyxa filosa]|uniref:Uncharacterized protein n=1 Tax=Reticulomyxa filosa TaxID=46433 RepID=X6M9V3_RETFI|nr:hypothetical protein RFI_26589 [Reticulomyxa filosa]|eukprot:ETO10788.1 hypothetical protein RFI_26589 [Reticulomyxa filosa]
MYKYGYRNAPLAFAQLQYIQETFISKAIKDKFAVRYEICHVGELSTSTIEKLETLLNETKVRDLSGLIKDKLSVGSEWSKSFAEYFSQWNDLPFFRGFPCKPTCLATIQHSDHVIIVDDDICFFQNPFELLLTPEYNQFGNILFRDRLERNYKFVPFLLNQFIPEFVSKFLKSYVCVQYMCYYYYLRIHFFFFFF